MRELFVYYRVRVGSEAEALGIVEEFQARLRQERPGLQARLLRRPVASDAAQTWMETYALATGPVEGGIDTEFQQMIEAAARPLVACLDGPRHTEVFEALDRLLPKA